MQAWVAALLCFSLARAGLIPLNSIHHSASRFLSNTAAVPANDLQYHGTTTVAVKVRESIYVCVDSKASLGSYIGSRLQRVED